MSSGLVLLCVEITVNVPEAGSIAHATSPAGIFRPLLVGGAGQSCNSS